MGSAPCSAIDLWHQGLHFSISNKATGDLAPLCHALRVMPYRFVMAPGLALLPLRFNWRSGKCCACFSPALV